MALLSAIERRSDFPAGRGKKGEEEIIDRRMREVQVMTMCVEGQGISRRRVQGA